eukprot:COSAG02_NODE_4696_length_5085_cov_2.504813_6_plen_101_part_00
MQVATSRVVCKLTPTCLVLREATDTALDAFLEGAAEPEGSDCSDSTVWSARKLEVRLLASTRGSTATTAGGGDGGGGSTGAKHHVQEEELRLYSIMASAC